MRQQPPSKPRSKYLLTAFGETKSVWQWGKDWRCFVSDQALYQRMNNFPRPVTEADVEAAMCFTRSLWRHYRYHGSVPQEMIDELE